MKRLNILSALSTKWSYLHKTTTFSRRFVLECMTFSEQNAWGVQFYVLLWLWNWYSIVHRCSTKKLLQPRACNITKNRLLRRCFLVNYEKFFIVTIVKSTTEGLFLNISWNRLLEKKWNQTKYSQNVQVFLSATAVNDIPIL